MTTNKPERMTSAPEPPTGPFYKLLRADGSPAHGGRGHWWVPRDGQPGEWMTVSGALVPCFNGLHLVRPTHILNWAAATLYRADYDGEIIEDGNKVVVRRARLLYQVTAWNEETLRLFAADCARRALPVWEERFPLDTWPRQAIETARRFAHGMATRDELTEAQMYKSCAEFDWTPPQAAAAAAVGTTDLSMVASASRVAEYAATAVVLLAERGDHNAIRDREDEWQTQRLMMLLGENYPDFS